MLLVASALWLFVKIPGILTFSRVLSGFFSTFIAVFVPIWVDLHGK
jgi:hypothetical protein